MDKIGVVKGFQVKIFDVLIHLIWQPVYDLPVVKGFQVKIFDVLIHPEKGGEQEGWSCERLSGQDL